MEEHQHSSYLPKHKANRQAMQFISVVTLTICAIASQVMASNVAFNVAPQGTGNLNFLAHADILTKLSIFFQQHVERAPPSAARCPPANLAREISPQSKLPSLSPRLMGTAMSACTRIMTSKEASSRGSTRTRLALVFSLPLRSIKATVFSAVRRIGGR